jgi:hypothetical protein
MRRARIRPFAAGAVAVVALLAVASQLLLPGYLEGRVEDRLTRRGGSAEVSLSAFPAARLLADHGSEISISGGELTIDLTARNQHVFDRLDGFDRVDVRLSRLNAAPFDVDSFRLRRHGEGSHYAFQLTGSTSGRALADFAARRLAGALGGLLGGLAADALPASGRAIPFSFDLELASSNGSARVVAGGGSLAGIPTGPLGELIANAVISRL